MPGGIQDDVLLFKFSGHLPARLRHVSVDDRPHGLTIELNHSQLVYTGIALQLALQVSEMCGMPN